MSTLENMASDLAHGRPIEQVKGRRGPAERALDEEIANLRRQQREIEARAEIFRDPRWSRFLELAKGRAEEDQEKLLKAAEAGDVAKSAYLAGRIRVLKDHSQAENELKVQHQKLEDRIQGLQKQRAEAQTKDVLSVSIGGRDG